MKELFGCFIISHACLTSTAQSQCGVSECVCAGGGGGG